MDVLTHMLQSGDGLDKLVTEVPRIGRGKANALDARNGVDALKQLIKGHFAAGEVLPIRVHGLPKQSNLFGSLTRQHLYLGNDLLRQPAALSSARQGHNAERAELIATIHNGHMRL